MEVMALNPAPDGRRERWRAHREARRRELVAAVVAAVQDAGAGVGMDDIAAHSGISKQVFYRYFADKADLHLAVGRSVARVVVADVTTAIEAGTDLRAMLTAGISRYLSLIESQVELYRFVVHTSTSQRDGGSAGAEIVTDFETVLGLQVARLIGDRLRAAGGDAGAAEPWGFALVGAVRAAADRWLAAPTMTRAALVDYLSEFAWNGLSNLGGQDAAGDGAEVKPLVAGRRSRAR